MARAGAGGCRLASSAWRWVVLISTWGCKSGPLPRSLTFPHAGMHAAQAENGVRPTSLHARCSLLQGIPLALCALLLTDSPVSLAVRGRPKAAILAALERLRGTAAVEAEAEDLLAEHRAAGGDACDKRGSQHGDGHTLGSLRGMAALASRYPAQLTLCLLLGAFRALTGNPLLLSYGTEVFAILGYSEQEALLMNGEDRWEGAAESRLGLPATGASFTGVPLQGPSFSACSLPQHQWVAAASAPCLALRLIGHPNSCPLLSRTARPHVYRPSRGPGPGGGGGPLLPSHGAHRAQAHHGLGLGTHVRMQCCRRRHHWGHV